MSFRVTVEDLKTGEKGTEIVADGDFFLATFEPCHLASTQSYPGKGTVVLTIKGHKPAAVAS